MISIKQLIIHTIPVLVVVVVVVVLATWGWPIQRPVPSGMKQALTPLWAMGYGLWAMVVVVAAAVAVVVVVIAVAAAAAVAVGH